VASAARIFLLDISALSCELHTSSLHGNYSCRAGSLFFNSPVLALFVHSSREPVTWIGECLALKQLLAEPYGDSIAIRPCETVCALGARQGQSSISTALGHFEHSDRDADKATKVNFPGGDFNFSLAYGI
jgi:hypothetical protein